MQAHRPLLILSCLSVLLLPASGEEWSRFRGPNGTGHIDTTSPLPTTLDPSKATWNVPIGKGWSSPILWKDKIFLTMELSDRELAVQCLNAKDGSAAWTYKVPFQSHKKHNFNSFASASPCADDERVYVNWTSGDTVGALALTHEGKLVWKQDNLAPYVHEHGSGCSAVVVDGVMVVRSQFQGPDNCILGLDAATGTTRWKLPVPSTKNPYSTPVVRQSASGTEIILADGANGFMGISAREGKMNWQHNPGYKQRSVGSFALVGNQLFGTLGSGGGGSESAMLQLGDKEPKELYSLTKRIPYVPTPLVVGSNLYLLGDGGIFKCHDYATGEEKYEERLVTSDGRSTKYFSSPVSADGKVYCCSQSGDVLIVKTGDQFQVLSSSKLDAPIHATPAIANGRIYIRTEKSLWCFQGPTIH